MDTAWNPETSMKNPAVFSLQILKLFTQYGLCSHNQSEDMNEQSWVDRAILPDHYQGYFSTNYTQPHIHTSTAPRLLANLTWLSTFFMRVVNSLFVDVYRVIFLLLLGPLTDYVAILRMGFQKCWASYAFKASSVGSVDDLYYSKPF